MKVAAIIAVTSLNTVAGNVRDALMRRFTHDGVTMPESTMWRTVT